MIQINFIRGGKTLMSHSSQHERRAAQRFPFHLPVAIRLGDAQQVELGFTQDISARGAFFYTECPVAEGSWLELTLSMPATITLTENLRVLCRAQAIRIQRLADGIRMGVAVRLYDYEFLPTESSDRNADFDRICSLHEHRLRADESQPQRFDS
jgi:hypothetical protein